MPILGLFALLIADASGLGQSMPDLNAPKEPLEQLNLPLDSKLKVLPFEIEGSVETFDPEKRAKELVKSISRNWCGTYTSSHYAANYPVNMVFSEVQSIGQMVVLQLITASLENYGKLLD